MKRTVLVVTMLLSIQVYGSDPEQPSEQHLAMSAWLHVHGPHEECTEEHPDGAQTVRSPRGSRPASPALVLAAIKRSQSVPVLNSALVEESDKAQEPRTRSEEDDISDLAAIMQAPRRIDPTQALLTNLGIAAIVHRETDGIPDGPPFIPGSITEGLQLLLQTAESGISAVLEDARQWGIDFWKWAEDTFENMPERD